MVETLRHVRDIEASDRQALEHIIGSPLHDDQQVFIVTYASQPADPATRNAARARLEQTFSSAADRAVALEVDAQAADAAVDEAMRYVRPRPD